MNVEISWREVNTYRAEVFVNEADMVAAGYDPASPDDVLAYIQTNEDWVESVTDFNAAHQAVLEREPTGVGSIDRLTAAVT